MEIEVLERDIDKIIPYERNPRKNDEAVDKVTLSLKEFGWQQPIVVDTEGCIVVGHTRWKAAKKLNYKTCPVIVASNLSPEQIKAYRIADNKSGEIATWDNEDIRQFNKRDDLPDDLYNLDLLDGSPPCSTFSMAGSREKAWGKSKQFREGQSNQTLDDLVFMYCDTIIKLQPKVFLLENVKGIIQGNAKVYSKKIVSKMESAGYTVQVFLLNAASMGVPQKRERVFFIGHKKGFKYPKLKLEFNEKPILFGEIYDKNDIDRNITDKMFELWQKNKKAIDILDISQNE